MKFPYPILFVLFACNTTPASKAPVAAMDTVKNNSLPAPISEGNFTFLDFDTNGDEYLFIVCKKDDTLSMIYNTDGEVPYKMGDEINLVWIDTTYRPAGDPEYPVMAHFAQKHKLVKEGPLSHFLKRYGPSISINYGNELTDYARDIIYKVVCNYLATSTREPLRNIIDTQTDSISIKVEDLKLGEKDGYLIRLKSNESPLPQLYFHFDEGYHRLHEYEGDSLKPAL